MDAREIIEQTVGIGAEGAETMDKYEYYKTTLLGLKDLNDKLHWTAGDILSEAKNEYGEGVLEKLSYDVDVDVKTLKQWAWVSSVYPEEDMRNTTRSWSHYRAAAATEAPMLWVIEAENGCWSERKLREEIKNAQDQASVVNGTLCAFCQMPLPESGSRHVRMDGHKEASLCSTKCTLEYYLRVYDNEQAQIGAPVEVAEEAPLGLGDSDAVSVTDIFGGAALAVLE